MTDDRARETDWKRTQWEGEGQDSRPHDDPRLDDSVDRTTEAGSDDRWTKTQWVGEGQGSAGPSDPSLMEEGENRLSGDRHAPGEEHWGRGQSDPTRRDR